MKLLSMVYLWLWRGLHGGPKEFGEVIHEQGMNQVLVKRPALSVSLDRDQLMLLLMGKICVPRNHMT